MATDDPHEPIERDPAPASDAQPLPDGEDVAHEKLRKNIAARLTRLITSEEGLRTVVNTVVPKELLASTLEQVDATKSEAMAMVGRELRTFLAHLDVGEELAKILTAVSFEIRLEVRFIPNEDGTLRANVRGGAKPKVKIEPRRKRWRRRGGEDDGADDTPQDDDDAADELDPNDVRGADETTERAQGGGDRAAPADGAAPAADAAPTSRESTPPPSERITSPELGGGEESGRRPRSRLGRRAFTSMVERVADAAATTARVAAEVAADAAADVVNEARRNRDESDDLDDY